MARSFKLIGPWSIPVSKKKGFSPNLNQYRNAHYRTLSKAKRMYAEALLDQLKGVEPFEKVQVTLIAYPPSKRDIDCDNLAPHMKFAMDAVVKAGILKDDNYKIIVKTIHYVGYVDKENPRVEFILEEVK